MTIFIKPLYFFFKLSRLILSLAMFSLAFVNIAYSNDHQFPIIKPSYHVLASVKHSLPIEKSKVYKIHNIPNEEYIEFLNNFSLFENYDENLKMIKSIAESYLQSEKVTHKTYLWYYLRSPKTEPKIKNLLSFINSNPNWPDLDKMRHKVESYLLNIDNFETHSDSYFNIYDPLTGDGYIALSILKIKNAEYREAQELYKYAWHNLKISSKAKKFFLGYCSICINNEDTNIRFNRMLYLGDYDELADISPLLDDDYQNIYKIAFKIKNDMKLNEIDFIRLENQLSNNSTFQYLKLHWLVNKKYTYRAYEHFNKQKNTVKINIPLLWAVQSEIVGRRLIADGRYKESYEVMTLNYNDKNQIYANLEFLKGWLSIRKFNDPKKGISHFHKQLTLSETNSEKAKATYWLSEAYFLSDNIEMGAFYQNKSAAYINTFYGQVSFNNLSQYKYEFPELDIPGDYEVSFQNNDYEIITSLLTAAGKKYFAAKFINKEASFDNNPNKLNLLSNMAFRYYLPQTGIQIAKKDQLSKNNILNMYPINYFPLPHDSEFKAKEFPELIYAIIRQESEFSSEAISYSGALGLMQIMPNTGKMLARQEKLHFTEDRLIEDPIYNVQLGTRYITDLIDDFDGSYVYPISAYNAGPNRVNKWVKSYKTDDILDWIELIPYRETRGYVKNVLRNIQFYRILLNNDHNEINILHDLKRGSVK
tara:strand:- start:63 stop:2174 length:2112 start_codon:yes stop_codon:yes gene_type:complete